MNLNGAGLGGFVICSTITPWRSSVRSGTIPVADRRWYWATLIGGAACRTAGSSRILTVTFLNRSVSARLGDG
jgi:hypothetical protein